MARKMGKLKAKAQGTSQPAMTRESCAKETVPSLVVNCVRAGLREPDVEETVEQVGGSLNTEGRREQARQRDADRRRRIQQERNRRRRQQGR